jgi:hypothetical protein
MDFNDKQWKTLQEEVNYMQEISNGTIDVLTNDNNEIAINGVNQNCETFVLNKCKPKTPEYEGQDLTFNCCKTRELPYDIYVWHLLVFCAGMINNTDLFSISRDR